MPALGRDQSHPPPPPPPAGSAVLQSRRTPHLQCGARAGQCSGLWILVLSSANPTDYLVTATTGQQWAMPYSLHYALSTQAQCTSRATLRAGQLVRAACITDHNPEVNLNDEKNCQGLWLLNFLRGITTATRKAYSLQDMLYSVALFPFFNRHLHKNGQQITGSCVNAQGTVLSC